MLLCLIILIVAPSCLSSTLVKRMVGAEPGEIEKYPYLVLMNPDRATCTGAILSRSYVLTAAHCVHNLNLTNMFVEAGSTIKGLGSRHYFTLEDVFIHENYRVEKNSDGTSYVWNDIAVIRVREPFEYDNTCQPIRLADRGYKIEVNATAKGAGWGTDQSFDLPDQFSTMDLNVIDKKSCNETLKIAGGFESSQQFCASADLSEVKFYFYGDSGGPLVIGNRTVGVLSNFFYMPTVASIGIFSEVGFFRDWIDAHVIYDDPENTHYFDNTYTYESSSTTEYFWPDYSETPIDFTTF